MFEIAFLVNLLLFFLGNSFLRLFWPCGKRFAWIYFPLSYFLGESFVVIWMYVLSILGINFSAITIDIPLIVMALLARGWSFRSLEPKIENLPSAVHRRYGTLEMIFAVVVGAYIVVQIIYVVWMASAIPIFEWDVIWRIGLKAKVLFFERGIGHLKDLPYPGYALGGPFMMSWASWHCWRMERRNHEVVAGS